MADQILRGTADGQVRFFITDCTEVIIKAAKIHKLSLSNSIVLGKLLCAGVILGANLKSGKDVLTIYIEGDGPSGKAIVTVNNIGQIKGLISNPENDLENTKERDYIDKLVLGNGVINIIKDMGLKSPYAGKTEMKYGNLAQDLTYYFVKSEQIPTSVGLGVLIFPDGSIRKAGGFIIQLLPGHSENIINVIEKNLSSFPNLTDVLDMGYSLEHIIKNMILKDLAVEISEGYVPEYRCGCSRKKMKSAIKLLNEKEIQESLEEAGFIEMNCHFCNKSYKFKKEDIYK